MLYALPIALLLYGCSGIKYTLSTNKKELEITGFNEVVTREDYIVSGDYKKYESIIVGHGIIGLENEAFTESTLLSTISLPSTLEFIGNNCFASCTSLQHIEIPENVTYINNSFYNCKTLQDISFPVNCYDVSQGTTFHSCRQLKRFIIAEGNKFLSTADDGKILVLNGDTAINCVGYYTSITIPKYIRTIRNHFMNGCYSVQKVEFEEGSLLNSVGYRSFRDTGIKVYEFPEGLVKMGENVFDCNNIELLSLPSTLSDVSTGVFTGVTSIKEIRIAAGCKGLRQSSSGAVFDKENKVLLFIPSSTTVLHIPKTVLQVDSSVIRMNTNIENLTVEENHTEYYAEGNILYNAAKDHLRACAGGTKVANIIQECRYVDGSAFSNTLIENVTFEGETAGREFANSAFISTKNMNSFDFPEGLTKIATWAFKGSSLKKAVMPSTLNTLEGYAFGDSMIETVNFSKCSSLKQIGDITFSGCRYLNEVILPQSLEFISQGMFQSCVALKKISIPPSVAEIGDEAFLSSGVSSITFEGSKVHTLGQRSFSGTSFVEFAVPDSVKTIRLSSFEGCTKLKSLTFSSNSQLETLETNIIFNTNGIESIFLGSNVATVAPGALCGSLGLKNITVSKSNPLYIGGEETGLLYADGRATVVACGGGIESVFIEATVSKIGDSAFFMCSNLALIEFSGASELKHIGESTFYGCSALKNIVFPGGLSAIGANAFMGCKLLARAEFPAQCNITEIGASAFEECSSLISIAIPKSIRTVGSRAFANCAALRTVQTCLQRTADGISSDVFSECSDSLVVLVGLGFMPELTKPKVGGANALRIIDPDCRVPTAAFTLDGGYGVGTVGRLLAGAELLFGETEDLSE